MRATKFIQAEAMSEEDELLEEALAAATVADALKDGDFDTLVEVVDLLEAGVLEGKIKTLIFGIIWELLSEETKDKIVATAQAQGKNNVIDFLTREPRE